MFQGLLAISSRLSWQEGFGAFSYSHSQISEVATYIENREVHHLRRNFHEEYSKVQKYVDSESVNNDPTAAGEDCILASLERPSNYRLYYILRF